MAASPLDLVQSDLRAALKAGERETVATLRLLLTALQNARIERGREVDETAFLALVQKAIKQRHDSAAQYRAGGREELALKEEREAVCLEGYLPPQADEGEIREAIREFVAAGGLAGPAAIGPVMKEMLQRFSGRADGATINRLAREVLAE